MSIKETIRAEIERLESENNCGTSDFIEAKRIAYNQVKRILDSLPEQPVEKTSYDTQKYTPRFSVSIEDVARVQFASHAKVFDKKRKAVFDWEQFKEVAGIFYGFGKRDQSETKEKEQPVEGLEEAAVEIADNLLAKPKDYAIAAKADYWNGAHDGTIAGAEWQKAKMMEEAVEGEVLYTPYPTICLDDCRDYDMKDRSNVRVILIREEEK